LDNDRDSFYSRILFSIDVDVSYGTSDLFMKVYYKKSTESNYTYIGDTDNFNITEGNFDDVYSIELFDSKLGFWDIRFEILFVVSETVELTNDDTDDSDLDNIPMEPEADDISQ
jgi:hypothetical protein